MRNPLVKRIPKELASDWHKYLVIILFMVGMIGVISGMYVGRDSMIAAINAGKEELNLEDGCFELSHKASDEMLDTISGGGFGEDDEYGHELHCLSVWHCFGIVLHTETKNKQAACWKDYLCNFVSKES